VQIKRPEIFKQLGALVTYFAAFCPVPMMATF
jgi:hypothetical protein